MPPLGNGPVGGRGFSEGPGHRWIIQGDIPVLISDPCLLMSSINVDVGTRAVSGCIMSIRQISRFASIIHCV